MIHCGLMMESFQFKVIWHALNPFICSLIKSQTIYDGLRHRCVVQPGIYANQQFSQQGHEKKNRHINKKACASSTSNFLCECFLLIQSEMMDRGHVTLIIKQAA